jgi:alkaline phosphatase
MRIFAAALLFTASLVAPAAAQTIYPIDRADILAGSHFDFKVEFPGLQTRDSVPVTVNGEPYEKVLGQPAVFVEREDGKDQSALILRDITLKPGTYRVQAGPKTVTWNVYSTGKRLAKNVILFIGDGMSPAHRTGARLLSKGIDQGKSLGKLAIDDMPHMALVATAGSDSIITDSANSASAYATGHKTASGAMGVYADRTANPFDDPKVEPIGRLVKRRDIALGIVTNTEIEDATPAAMAAHTRRRDTFNQIVEQYFDVKPDVLMGGGLANFLPKDAEGSKRRDDTDYLAKFNDAGYRTATTAAQLHAANADASTSSLLGLFNLGNMDGVLDRKFLKSGTVDKFPDQPDLTDQVKTALNILSKKPNGFFLMVESGLIDKYAHQMDFERAVYDTIMLDNVVRQTKEWAKARGNDTLIMVVSDHNHSNSLIGTMTGDMSSTSNVPLRERVSIYDKAGFPTYPKPDADGYPDRVDVSRRLAIFSAASSVVNSSVHSGEDVILTATGPGSERVQGSMDNTEVFRVIVETLGLANGE